CWAEVKGDRSAEGIDGTLLDRGAAPSKPNGLLFDVWQDLKERTAVLFVMTAGDRGTARSSIGRPMGPVRKSPGREEFEGVVMIVDGQANLLEVIGALCQVRGFTHLLNRRYQEGDQNRDDRDHDQQFDQREPGTPPAAH